MKKLFLLLIFLPFIVLLYSEGFFENVIPPKIQIKEPIQGERDDPYGAIRYRYDMIKGKKAYLDPLARQRAITYTKKFLLRKAGDENTISWTPVGPGNIGGRIRSILIRPTDANTILIGAVSGGIWKSTDGGSSWSSKTDGEDQIAFGSMANNGDIVYAGTGEGWGNNDAVYGGGIYKSTDFGDSWSLLSSTTGANIWNFKNILKLAFDPSGNIYAVTKAYDIKHGVGDYYTNGGLYKSTDGGTSWTNISSSMAFGDNYFNGCDVIPISSTIILFATKNNGGTLGGIFKTTDGGTGWNKMTSGLPTTTYSRIALAQDPSNTNNIYAVFHSTDYTSGGDAGLKGIYKSTDGGDNWSALTRPDNITSTGSLSYLSNQGWYDNVMAVDPFNSNNLYVGGVDMMKSTDGGSSWSHLTYWHSFYGTPVVHADHHAIAFDPSTANVAYNGDDGGIYKTTNGGADWTALNNGLEITQFYDGAVYPTGNTFYGGTQDNGHLKYSGTGTDWTTVAGGDGGYAAVDQSNPLVAYEEYVYLAISKTTNGSTFNNAISGLTDATSSSLCLFIAPFDLNPENSSVLVAGSNKVWITTNSAGVWTQSSNTLSSSNKVSAVTIVDSSSPYLGFAGTTDGKIFKCTSLTGSSDTWNDVTPVNNNGAYVRRIVVDLNNKQHIYACYSGYNNNDTTKKHVLYSSNQGTNWSDISGDLPDVPVHSLVIDPNDSLTLYIGTETGVYQTTNGGTNWANVSSGMPSYVPVDRLVLQTGTNKLFAFTHGRSVFVTTSPIPVELTSFSSIVENEKVILNWETATESNNYGFDIERSTNSSGWTKVGFVKGNGNSTERKQYSFVDNYPTGGTSFNYRLKQIDYDGHFKYSETVNAVVLPIEISLSQNYPNPFNPTTTIRYELSREGNISLKVYDAVGREVKTLVDKTQQAGRYQVTFNASDLASGVYFYTLRGKGFTQTKKLMVMK